MIKNFILTAIRSIKKNIFYAVINILGLAVALAVCITAFFNNKWDWDFDKFHENHEEIYKIHVTKKMENREQEYGICPIPVADKIEDDIPSVQAVVKYSRSYSPVKKGENILNEHIGYTTSNFTEVFTLNMIKGDKNALKDKNKILISDKLAESYFGETNPMGKVVSIFNDKSQEYTFIVGGVYETLPDNSSFYFNAVTNIENYFDMWEVPKNDYHHWYRAVFLQIKNKSQVNEVRQMLQDYIPIQNKEREDWKISSFRLEPLLSIHKTIRDRYSTSLRYGLHPAQSKSPPLMAIFILIIACFNFINTSIAFAGKRLKEIGIRKVFGGSKKQIVLQFLTENFLLALLSILIGLALSKFLIQAYSQMWPYMELNLTLAGNSELLLFLFGLLFVTTILAGAYPAFYISSFRPVKILRERTKLGDRNVISKVLLTLQLMISVVALVAGVVFTQNAEFQRNLDLGYDKENLIVMHVPNHKDFEPMEQVIKSNPMIANYAGTNYHIGWGTYTRTLNYQQKEQEINMMNVGINYLQAMGIDLTEGRYFEPEFESSDLSENSAIVNKKLVENLNWKNPLGKTAYINDTTQIRVVGVVENFYLYGTWSPVEPLAFLLEKKENYDVFAVQAAPGQKKEVNSYLKEKWGEVIPYYPYEGRYQEEFLQEAKDINKHIKEIFIFLALVASLLSAVGLFALVSLRIISKTKEIGIRKVVGASVPIVMKVLSKPYIIITSLSILLGSIGGYFISLILMKSLWAQHITPNTISFMIPIILIVIVTTATVIGRIYRAASQNPARSLRYE